jgi:hypothetical protein
MKKKKLPEFTELSREQQELDEAIGIFLRWGTDIKKALNEKGISEKTYDNVMDAARSLVGE